MSIFLELFFASTGISLALYASYSFIKRYVYRTKDVKSDSPDSLTMMSTESRDPSKNSLTMMSKKLSYLSTSWPNMRTKPEAIPDSCREPLDQATINVHKADLDRDIATLQKQIKYYEFGGTSNLNLLVKQADNTTDDIDDLHIMMIDATIKEKHKIIDLLFKMKALWDKVESSQQANERQEKFMTEMKTEFQEKIQDSHSKTVSLAPRYQNLVPEATDQSQTTHDALLLAKVEELEIMFEEICERRNQQQLQYELTMESNNEEDQQDEPDVDHTDRPSI